LVLEFGYFRLVESNDLRYGFHFCRQIGFDNGFKGKFLFYFFDTAADVQDSLLKFLFYLGKVIVNINESLRFLPPV